MLDVNYKFLLIIFVIISFLPITSADVISLNPGGGQNLAVTPDKYIEGFFFGIEVVGAICGNGVIETGETCDDGNLVDNDGCSSSCQTEAAPPGPGPGGGAITPAINLAVSPAEFNINLAINTNVERTITVTNLGTSTVTVGVSQLGLDNMVILGATSLTIAAGQSVDLTVVFVALDETGIFTGRIVIGGRAVLVSINVKTKLLLFDSNIVVLNKNYEVRQGSNLRTLVTLIPLGDPERLDVTLNFVIKDYANNVYLTSSETLLIEDQVELRRNFDTGALALGDYIIGLELVYPDGVAPSSAHFTVIPPASIFGKIALWLIILILIILIIIIIILIIRRLNERQKQKILSLGI